MEKLVLSELHKEQMYRRVEHITPHSDIYFSDHIRPTARNCFVYATHLTKSDPTIDPVVCEMGGLLHDIGYSKEFESEENDHIVKGTKMAADILGEINMGKDHIEQIVDTIWTHDGNLNRSRYKTTPINNKIVNDVDSMQLFDWPLPTLLEFLHRLQPDRSNKEIAKGILDHVHQTFKYISLPFFQDLARPKYEAQVTQLKKPI